MKRNRYLWFCLWVLSVIGISLKGGAVTYGCFAVLTLIPLLSLLYLLAVCMLFHIYQELEQRFVSVNEPVRYRFALVNEYPLQFVGIRVRFFSSFSSITDLDDATEYELKPNTRIEKETRLICKYRGEYEIGIKEIEIQDYFRLFRIRYRNKECIHAVVKPQLVKVDALGGIALSEAVRECRSRKNEPDIISRAYIPGDDSRFINWSQSARTASLMTRNMTGADHQEIAIITDTFRNSLHQAEYLPAENKILETALALSYYFSRNNISAAEYHLGQGLERLTVEGTWKCEACYEQISEIRFSSLHTHNILFESAVQGKDISDSSMAFLILSLWDAAIDTLLRELERSGLSVVICLISCNEQDSPDLSGHKNCTLIRISPFGELTKELGV